MKHLPTSAAAVLHHNNDFLYSNLTQYLIELPKPSKTNMKKMYQIHNIFKNFENLTIFFQNSCCKVEVTRLDIESKYSIKKPLL